jgi:hypothetical protein
MKPNASLSETGDVASGDGPLSPAFIPHPLGRKTKGAPAGVSSPFASRCYLITRFDRAEYRVPLQYIPLEQS